MNMKKLITRALPLLTLANFSYGQELTYLNCVANSGGDLLVVSDFNDNRLSFRSLGLDEDLEFLMTEGYIEELNNMIDGALGLYPTMSVSSTQVNWGAAGYSYRLDRMTGELFYRGEPTFACSPMSRDQAEALVQQRVDRRDEILSEIEATRLF
ncbi:MAG: hypothetical protein CMQ41_09435 [Gammaproteobacteria bacterium]|nr:hypothetical protein [Gammaproteobacteria bacterium]|tara:strand:- start:1724 stop:2185 length:462 start_codon:yes stop_codon:yes gene_type:complete